MLFRSPLLIFYLAIDYTKTIEQINRAPIVKSQDKKLAEAISQKERELTKVIRYKQAIYQDWKDNEISQTDYRRMREDYEEQERLGSRVPNPI